MKFPCLKPKFIMIAVIFVSLVSSGEALGIRTIPDNWLASPVLIKTKQVTGSGFYYKQNGKYYLVTARHVLFNDTYVTLGDLPKNFRPPKHLLRKIAFDVKSKRLYFFGTMSQSENDEIISIIPNNTSFENKIKELYVLSQLLKLKSKKAKLISYSSNPDKEEEREIDVNFEVLNKEHLILYNKSRDIAVVELGKTIEKENGKFEISYHKKAVKRINVVGTGVSVSQELVKKFDNVLVGNEVYVFGYPTSLSINPEIDINKPLLRKGIVAGKNENFKTIILDCPAFFGISGGLVLEIEQVALGSFQGRAIGIISKFVPFLRGWKENSGYSIAEPMDGLIELLSN
jgi:hypothetical protein